MKTDIYRMAAILLGTILFMLCISGTAWAEEPGSQNTGTETTLPEETPSLKKTARREATCAREGNIEYWTCRNCGKIFLDEKGTQELTDTEKIILPKLSAHTWKSQIVTKRATLKKTGKMVTRCVVCKKIRKQTAIPRINKIALSSASYSYNGTLRTPRVLVTDVSGKKISSKNYIVHYPKAKNVGTYEVKIIFRGRYTGTVTKKFKIQPQPVSGIRLTAGRKSFTVKYKKPSGQCSGCQLQYAKNSRFTKSVKMTWKKGNSEKTVKDLDGAATYYVRMRTFKNVKEGGKIKTYYSAWSKKKKVTTEKPKLICIDAGHQRHGNSSLEPIGPGSSAYKAKVSGGTSGVATGKAEYQLNLEIALKLQKELQKRGYDVLTVRTTHDVNISNSARAAIANNAKADAFIRIHANGSTNANTNGAVTICQTPGNPYCGAYYRQSRRLSEKVLEAFVAACGCKKENIWETDTMSGINWCRVPVTILEMGYMSNPSEDRRMSDPAYQAKMVQGIANGIDAYFAP